jgi:hypothetical protein
MMNASDVVEKMVRDAGEVPDDDGLSGSRLKFHTVRARAGPTQFGPRRCPPAARRSFAASAHV